MRKWMTQHDPTIPVCSTGKNPLHAQSTTSWMPRESDQFSAPNRGFPSPTSGAPWVTIQKWFMTIHLLLWFLPPSKRNVVLVLSNTTCLCVQCCELLPSGAREGGSGWFWYFQHRWWWVTMNHSFKWRSTMINPISGYFVNDVRNHIRGWCMDCNGCLVVLTCPIV